MFKSVRSILTLIFVVLSTATLLLASRSLSEPKKLKPWIRLNTSINHIKVDPKKGRYMAYSDEKKGALYLLDLKSKKNITVSRKAVDGSFIWSPDGIRLIYREQSRKEKGVVGALMVFDLFLNKNILLDKLKTQSGFLTFDPRDYKLMLMHEEGVIQKSIKLPDSRLAKWQLKSGDQKGRWVAGKGGIVYLSYTGKSMSKLEDDGSGVQSFQISPDGSKIVWATNKASIYVAKDGKQPRFLDHGKDPKWANSSSKIIYSGARIVGKKVSGFDLKMADLNKNYRWITQTSLSDERWPEILPNGSIIYTKASSTDLYSMEYKRR